MPLHAPPYVRPIRARAWIGLCVAAVGLAACGRTLHDLSYAQVVERIATNECAGAGLAATPMLIALWSPGDTTWIDYPDATAARLTPDDPVQLGALTTAYLVPELLQRIGAAGLTLDDVAVPVKSERGETVRDITFRQLLLHRSDLPFVEPAVGASELDQLLAMNRALVAQSPTEVKERYRFDHWNYALADAALSGRGGDAPAARRPRDIAYTDALPDSTRRTLLALTTTRDRTPRERKPSTLFAPSTAGVASAHQLLELLGRLSRENLEALPSAPTLPDRPRTSIVPGWHRITLKNDEVVYINAGFTRFFGAAVAYYPYTQTGVVITATEGKRLDCLAMDILRNLNQNWRRTPGDE